MTALPTTRALWEEAAAAIRPEGRAVIDGKLVDARSGKTFPRISPVDGRIVAEVADCAAADVNDAVAAARAAFEDGRWRLKSPTEKKRILLKFAELIRADVAHLALIETLEVGKVISNSVTVDVPSCANCIQYYAEFADKLYDEVAPLAHDQQVLVVKEPLGVVGVVVPWNYPLIITAWKIGPALLAGNSVVLKPAEQSPLGAIRLGQLALEAGIPAGVFNVVPGFGVSAGKPLALHMDVDLITFTGSTEVGKLMQVYAGQSNMKRVALECGGKSPHIVMADADLDAAAEGIAWGIFYNQGETCNAGSRVLAHASIRDALVKKVAEVTRAQIPLGHAFDPDAQMGAVVEEKHMERVLDYIEVGLREGARLALGGKRVMRETGGFYVEATILDDVKPGTRVEKEEIFGPVVVVTPFETEAEALAISNDSIFALAAAVWTRDMGAVHRLTRGLRTGTVWVNTFGQSSLATPFGGFKQSGFGRDRSPHAIEKYQDLKVIWQSFT